MKIYLREENVEHFIVYLEQTRVSLGWLWIPTIEGRIEVKSSRQNSNDTLYHSILQVYTMCHKTRHKGTKVFNLYSITRVDILEVGDNSAL